MSNERENIGAAPQQQELLAEIQRLQRALAFWLPQVPSEDHPLQDRIAHDAFLLAGYSGPNEPSANELGHVALTIAPAPSAQGDASPTMPKDIEMMATNRYRPVPSGVLTYKVVGGDGNRSLFSGTKDECQIVARKLTEAFLDGAHVALSTQPAAPSAQGDALDAGRYRLLRRGQRWSVIDGIGDTLRGDELDAAIDTARAAKEGDKP